MHATQPLIFPNPTLAPNKKDMKDLISGESSQEKLQDAPNPGSSQSPTKYGSCEQVSPLEWNIVMWRVPTNMTSQEREFSRQCTRAFPPITKKRNFHPIPAAQMIGRPVGGGTRKHSIINIGNPKGSASTHFCIHHRNGAHYTGCPLI